MDHPEAPRDSVVDDLAGHLVPDPYRWLEDAQAPAVRAWSAIQDNRYEAHRRQWTLLEGLQDRVRRLLATGMVGVPVWRGERCFRMRREPTAEHAVLTVTDTAGERVLVDPMALDPRGLTTLDAWQPSKEGDLVAYQVSAGGTEESTLLVLDVATGAVIDGPLDRTRYSPVAFLPAAVGGGRSPGFYYVRRLPTGDVPAAEHQFHRRVHLHRLGTSPGTDVEVFGAGQDIRSYYGVQVSRDGRWLLLSAATGTAPRNDLWIADLHADGPDTPRFRPVVTGLDAQTWGHVGRDGRLYLATDLQAPRGRLVVADPTAPQSSGWRTLLAEDPDAVLADHAVLDGPELAEPLLVASWTRHALGELTVHRAADGVRLPGAAGRVALPGAGSLGGLSQRPEGGPVVWFGYTDHTTAQQIHEIDARTAGPDGGLTARVVAEPPGLVTVPAVRSRLEEVTSADGTTVRMVVVEPGDRSAGDGPRPTILHGYGGFGVSLTPGYSAGILAWVEAGGVYVVANLRGGGEEGEAWHRAGMLGQKQRVFEDFEAAAEALHAGGVTTPERLCISGGSNGGLLVGAALVRRPDLYQAVICSAPLLDMVRYERFGLGATWNVEYGSAEDPEQLAWLLEYSPYHHVREGVDYPATLFTVFEGDTRVDPLHARKMCAALQHATTGRRPVHLRRETDVGHGARAVSRTVALTAESLAFAAHWTGLEPCGPDGTPPT